MPAAKRNSPLPALLRRYSQVFPVGSAGMRMPRILAARRKAHLGRLDSFAVFAGLPHEPGSENIWIMNALRIFQEPSLIYLTGINQTGVILVLDPAGPEKEVLFITEKDSAKEFWDGLRMGYPKGAPPGAGGSGRPAPPEIADVTALTGIRDVRPLAEFDAYFREKVAKAPEPHAYGFYHAYETREDGRTKVLETRTDHNWAFKERLERLAAGIRPGFALRTFAREHFRLRLPLDSFQMRDAQRANVLTGQAFRETLARLRGFRNENELGVHLECGMRRRSPFGLSFPSIIAGGRNATVLHYLKNDEPLPKKGLVLMDFGVRYGTMHADITRTAPMSGRFNPLQKMLYSIVLGAQKENQRNARPGETIRNLNRKVWQYIEDRLEAEFFSRGGKAVRSYSFQPHGVSHLMGEQEHDGDPHRLYQDEPLRPGWQISNEPGLYGHFAVKLGSTRYAEWIGIRIEDNLLITEKACRNLSRSVPKEMDEIEALIGS